MAIALCNPEIGLWYRDIENRLFEVIAIESEDAIEVLYYDGDITEYDRESWDLLCVNVISEPGVSFDFEEMLDDFSNNYSEKLNSISWDDLVSDTDYEAL